MANWIITNVFKMTVSLRKNILSFVGGEADNCSLSKSYFGNVLQRCCGQKGR